MYHVGSRHLAASRRRLRSLAAAASAAALLLFGAAATAQAAPHRLAATAPIVNVSSSCSGQNQEVVAAADTTGDVFQSWIGCGGIGFARSTNSGASYNAPIMLSGSSGAWDPALAVAPNGTVYAAFMSPNNYPVVEASFDHGATFTQTASVKPSGSGYFGDRPYIAVAPDGTVYVTWDYGPDQTNVQTTCSAVGSCSFADGQLNAVIEKSTDGGKTFGGFTAIGPDYPTMGGFAAPLLVDPHGRVDSLYEGHPTDTTSPYAIHNGYEYFTWSNDAGTTWPNPTVQVRPDAGTDAVANWWINGSIAIDAGGTLYATWDTQSSGTDIGWLSYSTDNGATWSAPTHVTPDNTTAAHIMEVVGGPAGTAYVGWQTNAPSQGYATYLQTFTTASGLVGTPTQVSTNYGNASVWPGDTFGLATLPNNQIAVSWGSADNGGSTAEIYATTVSTAPPASDFSLAANPTSGSVAQGSSATTTIATTASGGDTESVALSASGLPAGATAAFSPSSVTAGGSSTLTVSTASSTPVGTYQITVTGTGTAHTHTATFSLTVNGGSGGGGVTNGGFETGSFSGWTTTGNAAVTTAAKH
ncbi:sialidase family protein, partial [Streptacidiphilus jiangxiensis]